MRGCVRSKPVFFAQQFPYYISFQFVSVAFSFSFQRLQCKILSHKKLNYKIFCAHFLFFWCRTFQFYILKSPKICILYAHGCYRKYSERSFFLGPFVHRLCNYCWKIFSKENSFWADDYAKNVTLLEETDVQFLLWNNKYRILQNWFFFSTLYLLKFSNW